MTVIAVAQIAPVIGDPGRNRRAGADAIGEAATAGARLIVLPELCDSGYVFASEQEARRLATPADDSPTLRQWHELAAARQTVIVGGFCELGGDGRLYNSAALVDASGTRALYRKAHLWDREGLVFTPGAAAPPVVSLPFGRVALVICYDLEFPEWARLPALNGADLIAAPVNWPAAPCPPGERPAEIVKAQADASVNGVFVAVADRCGTERGVDWISGSVIIGPDGYPLAGPVLADRPAVLLADCDLARARDKRLNDHNDLLADRRPELYSPVTSGDDGSRTRPARHQSLPRGPDYPGHPASPARSTTMAATMPPTHEVFNQVPPLTGYDVADDPAMLGALRREGAGWAEAEVREIGRLAGTAQAQDWGRLANENPPVLHTHDRFGHRIDEVEFHPAWHELMSVAVGAGLHAAPWRDTRPGAHVARAAKFYLWGRTDAGHCCPVSMTYAIVPALRNAPDLARRYEPLLTSAAYDPGLRPPEGKPGLIAGMSMTEKQGGSDVRANTTRAVPAGAGSYLLTGHKWFTSAPMSDVFLVLAQAPGGLSCFLLPRVLPDGTRNGMHLQRLKSKLGNRSNASAEVEYDEAVAWLVGEEGRGVRTIIEMVNMTRLDCVLGAATSMRSGAVQAAHHAAHRCAFGARLADQPLMANVLADLAVEAEAATAVTFRLAGATDRAAAGDGQEAAFRRLALAATKYWVCKRAPPHAAEALECFGGNGYVEESGLPRLYREAPLQSIWEGSGNVAALDALRVLARQPESAEAFFAEVDRAAGADRRLDAAIARLRAELSDRGQAEARARRLAEAMAVVLQGSLLVRYGDPAVADAFAVSRLGGDWGGAFGTLPAGVDTGTIIDRVTPVLPPS